MRIVIDPDVLESFRATPAMLAIVKAKGERVAAAARSTAPDAAPIGKGYKDAFRVDVGIDGGGALCRVNNFDYKAGWVERGARAGGQTPVLGYRTLGKALETIREAL